MNRRRALKVLGAATLGGASILEAQATQQTPVQPHTTPSPPATTRPQPANNRPARHFFTAREMRTLRVLADDVIPRDHRSPSATEVGVPAFIDFHLSVPETSDADRVAWRGGLRWMDTESRKRFGVPYATASTAQRHAILDDISFPHGVPQDVLQRGAPPALRYGGVFFARARDMIAAGFFSTPEGWKDLRYEGNTFVPEWKGCPPEALAKLGVDYDLMQNRVKPA